MISPLSISGRFGKQAHAGKSGDALSAAAFAHHTHHFAGGNVEADAVQSLGYTDIGVKIGVQIVDPQDRILL